MVTSRTVKASVGLDEHSARCVAKIGNCACPAAPICLVHRCQSASLDPDYQDAVIESFIERVGREIDARVDTRLAAAQQYSVQPERQPKTLALSIWSIALGIPLSGISLGPGKSEQLIGLAVIWPPSR